MLYKRPLLEDHVLRVTFENEHQQIGAPTKEIIPPTSRLRVKFFVYRYSKKGYH
ncbi:hypothetical protein SAMN05518856_104277 [Paenibacillus sp. OK003]|nr:hypothetical protein SAMN05518856_104277 [Paenibacillus sp. OK003]